MLAKGSASIQLAADQGLSLTTPAATGCRAVTVAALAAPQQRRQLRSLPAEPIMIAA